MSHLPNWNFVYTEKKTVNYAWILIEANQFVTTKETNSDQAGSWSIEHKKKREFLIQEEN